MGYELIQRIRETARALAGRSAGMRVPKFAPRPSRPDTTATPPKSLAAGEFVGLVSRVMAAGPDEELHSNETNSGD
jgi:hypothetical protein